MKIYMVAWTDYEGEHLVNLFDGDDNDIEEVGAFAKQYPSGIYFELEVIP